MRKGGSYECKDGKIVLKHKTKVSEQGARPFNADGSPVYVRPHEQSQDSGPVIDEKKAAAPVVSGSSGVSGAKKDSKKGGE